MTQPRPGSGPKMDRELCWWASESRTSPSYCGMPGSTTPIDGTCSPSMSARVPNPIRPATDLTTGSSLGVHRLFRGSSVSVRIAMAVASPVAS